MQTVQRFEYQNKAAIVRFDVEWQEYVVQFYANNVWMDNSDYYTDCRGDAIETARAAIHDEREWCEANNLTGD